jgi:hypothetical protein
MASFTLKFGSLIFPLGQCEVLPSMQAQLDESHRPIAYVWTIPINGRLLRDPGISDANGSINLTNYENSLRALSSYTGQALTLYDLLGRPTSINFQPGPFVLSPMTAISYRNPSGGASEFVTTRDFSVVFQTILAANGRAGSYTQYHESVSIQGIGGPRVVWQESLNTDDVPCVTSPSSPLVVTVSGSATGYLAPPIIPPGLLSSALLQNPQSATAQQSPKFLGVLGTYRDYPVSWNYVYKGLIRDIQPQNLVARAWPLGR